MSRIANARFVRLVILLVLLAGSSVAQAQTTSFNYQGRLTDAGGPAIGAYDLQFKLYDALVSGTQIGATVTLQDVAVSTGTFTVTLDFGAAAFPGANRWLEIGVRPGISTGAFTTLTPRQQTTSTPYAVQSLNATNSGSADALSAACNGCVTGVKIATGQVARSLNGLFDNVTLAAGSNITIVPTGNTLTLSGSSSGNNWSLTGNAGTTPSLNFLGTTDTQPLAFKINGAEVMRLSAGGNLGIGTTTPAGFLHVRGASPVRILGDPLTLSGSEVVDFMARSSVFSSDLGGMRIQRQIPTGDMDTLFFAAASGSSASEVMRVKGNGGVGIGTANPLYKLHVAALGNHALFSQSDIGIGVWGQSTSNSALYGQSTSGYGVQGMSVNSTGVYGFSNTGTAIFGNSTLNDAIEGTAHVGGKSGIYGLGNNGANGVAGITDSGTGVYGSSNSNTGVSGNSSTGTGLIGTGKFGVSGFGHTGGFGGYFNNVDAGQIALFVEGTGRMNVLQVAGSDVAERFDAVAEAKPGLVVVIDPDRPGQLSIARNAYDRRVAGVISGANKLDAGMVLSDLPGSKNSLPVALSGRVWVYCDATRSAIQPGDLLTTSNIPGHAMKVTNRAKAQGATIGKAMTSLKSGRGLVLVLVTLQ